MPVAYRHPTVFFQSTLSNQLVFCAETKLQNFNVEEVRKIEKTEKGK